jgi:hypothetical protein
MPTRSEIVSALPPRVVAAPWPVAARRAFAARAPLFALLAALCAAGCGGSILAPEDAGSLPDGGHPDSGAPDSGHPDSGPLSDGGLTCGGGIACNFDTDCLPPQLICGGDSCCTLGCVRTGCQFPLVCNTDDGRCGFPGLPDAGPGTDAGPHDAGADAGPHDGGTKPDAGQPDGGGPSDGGATSDGGGGSTADTSGNPNGCAYCQPCQVAEDCSSLSACIDGHCAISCFGAGSLVGSYFCGQFGAADSLCDTWPRGNSSGGILDPGFCFPKSDSCTPDGGVPPVCVPGGPNSTCAPVTPGSPSATPENLPLGISLASVGASLVQDDSGYVAALLVQDPDGDTRIRIVASLGFTVTAWTNLGRVLTTLTEAQGSPSLAFSKWTDASGAAKTRYVVAFTTPATYPSGDGGTVQGTTIQTYYSDDAGTWTWLPGSNGETDAAEPVVAAGPNGAILLTYTAGGKAWVRSSTTHGTSWGTPAAALAVSRPALAFDPTDATGNTVVLAGNSMSTSTTGVLVARSKDRGQSWTSPYTLASGAAITSERPALVIGSAANIYVGASAAANATGQSAYPDPIVYRVDASGSALTATGGTVVSDTKTSCFQHRTLALALDGDKLYAAFSDDRDGGRGNIWVSASADRGLTWTRNARATAQSYFYDWSSTAGARSIGPIGLVAGSGHATLVWSDPGLGSASQARATTSAASP